MCDNTARTVEGCMSSPKVYLEDLQIKRAEMLSRLESLQSGQIQNTVNFENTTSDDIERLKIQIEDIDNIIKNFGMPRDQS